MKKAILLLTLATLLSGCGSQKSADDVEPTPTEVPAVTEVATPEPTEEPEQTEVPTEETAEPTEDIADEPADESISSAATIDVEGLPKEVADIVSDIDATIGSLIVDVDGFIANPETYTAGNYTEFNNEFLELLPKYSELQDALDKHKSELGSRYDTIGLDILQRQNEILDAMLELPELTS